VDKINEIFAQLKPLIEQFIRSILSIFGITPNKQQEELQTAAADFIEVSKDSKKRNDDAIRTDNADITPVLEKAFKERANQAKDITPDERDGLRKAFASEALVEASKNPVNADKIPALTEKYEALSREIFNPIPQQDDLAKKRSTLATKLAGDNASANITGALTEALEKSPTQDTQLRETIFKRINAVVNTELKPDLAERDKLKQNLDAATSTNDPAKIKAAQTAYNQQQSIILEKSKKLQDDLFVKFTKVENITREIANIPIIPQARIDNEFKRASAVRDKRTQTSQQTKEDLFTIKVDEVTRKNIDIVSKSTKDSGKDNSTNIRKQLLEEFSVKDINSAISKRATGAKQTDKEKAVNAKISDFYEQAKSTELTGRKFIESGARDLEKSSKLASEAAATRNRLNSTEKAALKSTESQVEEAAKAKVDKDLKDNPTLVAADKNLLVTKAKQQVIKATPDLKGTVLEKEVDSQLLKETGERKQKAGSELLADVQESRANPISATGRRTGRSRAEQRSIQRDKDDLMSGRRSEDDDGPLGRTGKLRPSSSLGGSSFRSSGGNPLKVAGERSFSDMAATSNRNTPTANAARDADFSQNIRKAKGTETAAERQQQTTLGQLKELGSSLSDGKGEAVDFELSETVLKIINKVVSDMKVK
jgi:hypothetical protein